MVTSLSSAASSSFSSAASSSSSVAATAVATAAVAATETKVSSSVLPDGAWGLYEYASANAKDRQRYWIGETASNGVDCIPATISVAQANSATKSDAKDAKDANDDNDEDDVSKKSIKPPIVVIALDRSGSMSSHLPGVISKLKAYVQSVDPNTVFLLALWDHECKMEIRTSIATMVQSLDVVEARGATEPHTVFAEMLRVFTNPQGYQIDPSRFGSVRVLFLTDGAFTKTPTANDLNPLLAQLQLLHLDLMMVYIGVKGDVPQDAFAILNQVSAATFISYPSGDAMNRDATLIDRLLSCLQVDNKIPHPDGTTTSEFPPTGITCSLRDVQAWSDAKTLVRSQHNADQESKRMGSVDALRIRLRRLVPELLAWTETGLATASPTEVLAKVAEMDCTIKAFRQEFEGSKWSRKDDRLGITKTLLSRALAAFKRLRETSARLVNETGMERERRVLELVTNLRSGQMGDTILAYVYKNITSNALKGWTLTDSNDSNDKNAIVVATDKESGTMTVTYTMVMVRDTSKTWMHKVSIPAAFLQQQDEDPITLNRLNELHLTGAASALTLTLLGPRTDEAATLWDGNMTEAAIFNLANLRLELNSLRVSLDTVIDMINRCVDRRVYHQRSAWHVGCSTHQHGASCLWPELCSQPVQDGSRHWLVPDGLRARVPVPLYRNVPRRDSWHSLGLCQGNHRHVVCN